MNVGTCAARVTLPEGDRRHYPAELGQSPTILQARVRSQEISVGRGFDVLKYFGNKSEEVTHAL